MVIALMFLLQERLDELGRCHIDAKVVTDKSLEGKLHQAVPSIVGVSAEGDADPSHPLFPSSLVPPLPFPAVVSACCDPYRGGALLSGVGPNICLLFC